MRKVTTEMSTQIGRVTFPSAARGGRVQQILTSVTSKRTESSRKRCRSGAKQGHKTQYHKNWCLALVRIEFPLNSPLLARCRWRGNIDKEKGGKRKPIRVCEKTNSDGGGPARRAQ